EDGFARVLGEKTVLTGVVALGYEEQRLELKKGLTVVHLQPKEDGISETSYDDLFKVKKAGYGIYYYYLNNVTDASKSVQAEIRFTEGVIKNDDEIIEILNYMDVDGDYKSSKEITGGADKGSKGIGRGEKFIEDENKVVSAVAYTTVTSKTIQGRPNASVIQTLQGQVAGLNISNDSLSIYGMKSIEDAHKDIPLRKNLNETAFFYPHLQTNDKGEIVIDFTAPEALTQWKFRGLAHNKSTDYIYIETLSRTQKDVMIQPNMPRFVRETDEVVLKARVSNTTAQSLNATAMLRLFNTITGEDLSAQIIKTEVLVPVTIEGLSANTVSWTVQIPKNIEGLQYRI